MYKKRILSDKIKKLFANFPVVVVAGARQVGKSTLLTHLFPEAEAVVFDPSIDTSGARNDPDFFLDNHKCPLILDEIQYAPELVGAVKRRVDKNKRAGMYVITGSQQWSVMKSVSESLAGRAIIVDIEGFAISEIAELVPEKSWLERWFDEPAAETLAYYQSISSSRTLLEQLWRGWLPEADRISLEFIPDYYRSYIQTYIERDARLQVEATDWQGFGKFIQLMSSLTAQEINYSQLGREIGISRQTAQRWLDVLKATFQWFEILPYSGNAVKKVSGKPKGYIADTGIACSLNMISSHNTLGGHPLLGSLFETAVVAEIRKLCAAIPTPPQLYHWRSHSGGEVDLLLERDGCIYPIEIKVKSSPTKNDTRGISAFRKAYPNLKTAPGLVLACCHKSAKISETDYCLPWNAAEYSQ